jgi:adenosine deaminase
MRKWEGQFEPRFPEPQRPAITSFGSFLDHLRYRYNFLQSEAAYADVVCNYARWAVDQGICYAELQINLGLLRSWDLELTSVLTRIHAALDRLSRRPTLRFIVDLPWQFPAHTFETVLRQADALRQLGVVGLSMGGDETRARPREVAPIFEQARTEGLKTVCHAGEITDASRAREIVEILEPARVAHALSVADWIASLGPDAPPIDVCLTSNKRLGVIAGYADHPLRKWVEAGVPFTLSTDDPALFDTDLQAEYRIARTLLPDGSSEVKALQADWTDVALDGQAAEDAVHA